MKEHFDQWLNVLTTVYFWTVVVPIIPWILPELTRYYRCKLPPYGVMSYPRWLAHIYVECCFVVTRFGAFLTLLKALRMVYKLLTISIFILPSIREVLGHIVVWLKYSNCKYSLLDVFPSLRAKQLFDITTFFWHFPPIKDTLAERISFQKLWSNHAIIRMWDLM